MIWQRVAIFPGPLQFLIRAYNTTKSVGALLFRSFMRPQLLKYTNRKTLSTFHWLRSRQIRSRPIPSPPFHPARHRPDPPPGPALVTKFAQASISSREPGKMCEPMQHAGCSGLLCKVPISRHRESGFQIHVGRARSRRVRFQDVGLEAMIWFVGASH